MKEKIGATVLASVLAVTGPGVARANESVDKPLVTPDPIVETGVMPSQQELDLVSQKEREEVDKRFTEFLSGEGEYSDEALERKLFRKDRFLDLGFMDASANLTIVNIQSVLLFHKNVNGEEILAVGIKNREEERKITVVSWPVKDLMSISPSSAAIMAETNKSNSYLNIDKFTDEIELGLALDEKLGTVLNFSMDGNPEKYTEPVNDKTARAYEIKYRGLFSDKTDVNRQFLASIWRAPTKELSFEARDFFKSLRVKESLFSISSYDEFMNIANDSDQSLPFVGVVYYQK